MNQYNIGPGNGGNSIAHTNNDPACWCICVPSDINGLMLRVNRKDRCRFFAWENRLISAQCVYFHSKLTQVKCKHLLPRGKLRRCNRIWPRWNWIGARCNTEPGKKPGPWWRHQTETFSALLALCAGNSPVTGEFPSQSQWRGALMLSLICAWINGWINNHEAGDLRRHRAHYDVTVMRRRHHQLDAHPEQTHHDMPCIW